MDLDQQKYAENLLIDARGKKPEERIKYVNVRTEEVSDRKVREEIKQYVIFHPCNSEDFKDVIERIPPYCSLNFLGEYFKWIYHTTGIKNNLNANRKDTPIIFL